MILVTVGTQFFDELIGEVDRLVRVGVITDRVYAQIGLCKTEPTHLDCVRFDRQLANKMRHADLIITHAGTGSTIEAIQSGRPFIAVVNGGKAGDHQREFLKTLSTTHDFCWINSADELETALPMARPAVARGETSVQSLADDMRREIEMAANGQTTGVFGRFARAERVFQ